jgi:hypothetical protein
VLPPHALGGRHPQLLQAGLRLLLLLCSPLHARLLALTASQTCLLFAAASQGCLACC